MLITRTAAIVLALSAASAASAQDTGAHIARLDAELTEGDYNTLGDIVFNPTDAEQARATLDWLGHHFKRGASPFIAFAYARLLVGFAGQLPAAEAGQIRGTALAAMLYAASASMIEGLQCADATARSNRMQQFSAQLAGSGLLELDEPLRQQAAFVAVSLEEQTWPTRRTRDDARFQCANGMAAMTAGIQAGQVRERAPEPGEIGRQMAVTPPADFVYERRANEDWWKDADELRAQLPTLIAMLARVDRIAASDQGGPPPSEE